MSKRNVWGRVARVPAGLPALFTALGAVSTIAGCPQNQPFQPIPLYDAGHPELADAAARAEAAAVPNPNGPCRSAADCNLPDSEDAFCWNGGPLGLSFAYCGAFTPDLCQNDGDCAEAGADAICVPAGVCGGMQCGPKCKSDSDCASTPAGAFRCLATGHCGAAPCVTARDCPVDDVCASGRCGPRCCTNDADCAGFCVNGACSSQLGECKGDGSEGATPGLQCAQGT